MILDCIENTAVYANTVLGLQEMIVELKTYAESGAEGGKKIHGDRMFINDCRYNTQPFGADAVYEAHRKYLDVMYMLDGEEIIYVKPTNRLSNVTKEYDPAIEALLAAPDADGTAVRLQAGQFIVLFPQDAHCPSRCAGESIKVHKLIGKLAVDF